MNAAVAAVRSARETKRIAVGYGFWIFLLSDIVMFSCFFASYAVLVHATAGGQEARQLFDLDRVAIETACLLVSSFTCGLASIASGRQSAVPFQVSMAATLALGAAFLSLEVVEFMSMVARNAGPTHSAFSSAFFALVGCHGIHVSIGLLWLMTMMAQVYGKGFRDDVSRRILCFTLFWHALDIIWVALFTVVYLIGVAP
jgi:cytochrome o ubiquinol oxidase subunit 3